MLKYVALVHWKDGRSTASGIAAEGKCCDVAELYGDGAFFTQEGATLYGAFVRALLQAPGFVSAALPMNVGALRMIRYKTGDRYDAHTDESMSTNGFRADLAFTVVLQSAERGGELHVAGEVVDLVEGDVYLYPSTTVHGVTRVEEGERIVVVGWVQSMVRDHDKRALLAKLHEMVENPAERQAVNVQAVRNELLRRWGG